MYVMKTICFCAVFGLVSCSNNDPDLTAPMPNDESLAGATMIGGGSCTEADIPEVIGILDENGNFVPVDSPETGPQENVPSLCDEGIPAVIDAPGIVMSGSGSIELGAELYPISAAIVSSLSTADEAASEQMRSHYFVIIHDGETRVKRLEDEAGTVKIDYGMTAGRVALSLDVSAVGTGGIEGRTFEISDIDDIAVATEVEGDLAADVTLSIDHDANGQFSFEELTEITEGQISWVGSEPNVMITINALTADGLSINGSYTGDVEEVPNQ